ncbi:TspO/MBR family protein [Posidoniimonas polymericola]|nr:TspO/MBR family protein [Posidoniimonas polymericola]
MLTKPTQAFGLAGWLALCFAVAAIGAAASTQARSFYSEITQPTWAPPGWVFGPVWTVLYATMGVAAWLVWRRGGFAAHRGPLLLFLTQLSANAVWSWLFFAWRHGLWSVLDIVLLWVLIAATMAAFWRVQKAAALLLAPYLLWVTFAAALNLAIWRMNPGAL